MANRQIRVIKKEDRNPSQPQPTAPVTERISSVVRGVINQRPQAQQQARAQWVTLFRSSQ